MIAKPIVNAIDSACAHLHLKMFGERPALTAFLFHSCLEKEQDFEHNWIYPQERLTVRYFRDFLDYFLNNKYEFITPDQVKDIPAGTQKQYGILTFDDGYFNNFNLLPVLREYRIPAIFYIPTAYLNNGKKFWSDALYFHRKKMQYSDDKILREIMSLKAKKTGEIEDYIVRLFGAESLDADNDLNRFMTASELKLFASDEFVFIGNHTHQHEILTNLSKREVEIEFNTSQQILKQLLGYQPDWVSYPNGSFNNEIINIASSMGMHTGITTIMKKNYFPLNHYVENQLLLHRFNPVVVNGKMPLSKFRSSFQLKTQIKKWLS